MSRWSVAIFFILLSFIWAKAFAQSSEYQRPKKKAAQVEPPVIAAPVEPSKATSNGASKQSPTPTPPKTDSSGKVDISELENRYWAPKEDEFTVVQNRMYTKALRFSGTVTFGPVINDSYSDGTALSLSGNYYLSERMGVELNFTKFMMKNNKMVEAFIAKNSTIPDHNKLNSYFGAAFNWVPVYAKLSLLEKRIIYFDMSISPAIGFTTLDHQKLEGGGTSESNFTFGFDVSQHFFINKNTSFRFDYRNRYFNETITDYRNGNPLRTTLTNSACLLFGVTYYH